MGWFDRAPEPPPSILTVRLRPVLPRGDWTSYDRLLAWAARIDLGDYPQPIPEEATD